MNKQPIKYKDDGSVVLDTSRTIICDIDGVIFENNRGSYANPTPRTYGISRINLLYSLGYYIILYTARYGGRELGNIHIQYQRGYQELITSLYNYKI